MKKFILLFSILILFSCEKDTQEEFANLQAQTCNLIDPNPVGNTIYTYGVYELFNRGLDCTDAPSGTTCLPSAIVTEAPYEVWQQLEPSPNTRPISQSYYTLIGSTLEYPEIHTFDGYPTCTATDANKVYRAVVCDILSELEDLPSLPSNQMYSIEFSVCWIDYVFDTTYNYVIVVAFS